MDPFCIMKTREQEWKSAVCSGGGLNPKWDNQVFDVDVYNKEDVLWINVRDEDVMSSDNIGEGTIRLSSLIKDEKGINPRVELHYKGEKTGEVLLLCDWNPIQ